MLRSVSRKFKLLNLLAGAACLFNLFASGLGEFGRVHGQLLGELAVTENLDAVVAAFDETSLAKGSLINRGVVIETLEVEEVHDRMNFLEDVGEAALRQT